MHIHQGERRNLPMALQVPFITFTIIIYTMTYRPPTTDDPILACLSQAELLAYSQTCKQLYKTVTSYNKRAFRINIVLGAISLSKHEHFQN